MFDLKSNNLLRDAIALGNTLTFKQVCDLAKAEESAKALMKIMTQGEYKLASLHVVYDRHQSTESKQKLPTKKSRRLQFKSKSSLMAASHAEILTINLPFVLQKFKTQVLWQDWALCESVYEEKVTKTARDSR